MEKQINNKLQSVTEKVKRLIFDIPKYELAKTLGINQKTFDKRLETNDWKYREVLIIETLIEKQK